MVARSMTPAPPWTTMAQWCAAGCGAWAVAASAATARAAPMKILPIFGTRVSSFFSWYNSSVPALSSRNRRRTTWRMRAGQCKMLEFSKSRIRLHFADVRAGIRERKRNNMVQNPGNMEVTLETELRNAGIGHFLRAGLYKVHLGASLDSSANRRTRHCNPGFRAVRSRPHSTGTGLQCAGQGKHAGDHRPLFPHPQSDLRLWRPDDSGNHDLGR